MSIAMEHTIGRPRRVDLTRDVAKAWLRTPVNRKAVFAAKAQNAKSRPALFEMWIDALLARPRASEIALAASWLFDGWENPPPNTASMGDPDANEAMALLHGYVAAIDDAFRLGWATFPDGLGADAPGDMPAASPVNDERASLAGRFACLVGSGVRMPGRFHMSTADFDTAIALRGERRANAYRFARHTLGRGKPVAEAAAIYADVMAGRHVFAAEGETRSDLATFTAPLMEAASAVAPIAMRALGARIVAPFIRTPAALLTEATSRVLGSPFLRRLGQDVKAGGPRRSVALATVATAAAAMAWAVDLADRGLIAGGAPTDAAARARWQRTYQPYSAWIGGAWHAYGGTPAATLFGIAADYAQFRQWARDLDPADEGKLAARAVGGVVHRCADPAWFRAIAALAAAWAEPDRRDAAFAELGRAHPIAGGAQDIDPPADEFYAALDAVKARTPGWTAELPPQINFWGEDVLLFDGDWRKAFDPFAPRGAALAIDEALSQLGHPLKMPEGEAFGVRLDARQYQAMIQAMNEIAEFSPAAGDRQGMRAALNRLVRSRAYRALGSDRARSDALALVYARYLAGAKQAMITPGSPHYDVDLAARVKALQAAPQPAQA